MSVSQGPASPSSAAGDPVTEDQVIEALRPVEDPELHMSIVDLGMVKKVEIDGGHVAVQVALTVAGCPLRAEITERVTAALSPLDGVRLVDVDMTVMTDEERAAVRRRMQESSGVTNAPTAAGQRLGHEEGRLNPFMRPESRTRVLGISSGKGGVGKSSVTVNLAVALARRGHEVGLLDADVYGFSVPKMMGIHHDPVVIDDMVVPPVAHGVKVISMGFFVGDDQPVMWRGPMLHKALEQFLVDVYWGDLDYLLVDMPPGTGDVALSMAQYLPRSEVFVVTTPQPAAQRVAQRTAFMARKVNLPLRGVVENMSWFTGDDGKRYEIFGRGGGTELAESLGVPLLARVPLVPSLREGGDVGLPVTVSDPDGESSSAFEAMAETVEGMRPSRVFSPELQVS
ncbi:MAG TPA: Mrp/NBP35 family ATP-binding protein [Acidimicrobiales bacterium]|nr:Mrp/NBP35 family ATP-binding protein [Acidimicrobiales bacterium]